MRCAQGIRLVGLICLLAVFVTPSHGAGPLQPAAHARLDPNLRAFRLELAAYRQDLAALARRVRRMRASQQRLRALAAKLQGVGDNSSFVNVELQNTLQKQQRNLQMLSAISKTMSDTAKAIIKNIGDGEGGGSHYAVPGHHGVTGVRVKPPHTR